ncbi:MAG: Txe/YoeB family addiction module toxin [Bacilli bacterium]|jgi:Txe/YoeB family toxin of toxin-antitoxin system|nr:Txe/YoeB family addiction module toxin [Bacilli bacterium]
MEIVFTRQAAKDFEKIKQNPSLHKKVVALLELIEENPFQNPPSFEKLIGFDSVYSRRINIQHRLVYQVYEKEKIIKVIRMWTHYEGV